MSQEIAQIIDTGAIMERVLLAGDLSNLTPIERVEYSNAICSSLGVNPLTRPFDYIMLNGKLTLYAKKDCTDQLRALHKVSITITGRERTGDIYTVTARATNAEGRMDEDMGSVYVGKATGQPLADLFLKAITKAKRRVTLSICGLGFLDESEVETITGVQPYEAGQTEAPALPPAVVGSVFGKGAAELGIAANQPVAPAPDPLKRLRELVRELRERGVEVDKIQERMKDLTGKSSSKELKPEEVDRVERDYGLWLVELEEEAAYKAKAQQDVITADIFGDEGGQK